MIQGMIIKKVLDLVMKQLMKQFKLDKIQEYVEQPNELDKQVKALNKTVNKYGKYIEELEKDMAMLKDVANSSDSIKEKLKKVKKPRRINMQMLLANWEWVLLALYVVEKAVKLSPSKKDDVIFDMVVKPIFDKVKGK